ncbi:hypothetical protein DWW96_06045 [Eubacterium sp. AF17-7]|nr:hypothetical protein DWW96_06045 [Eubacterium sp. AF17-7]
MEIIKIYRNKSTVKWLVIKLFYGTFLLRICQKNRQQNGKKKVFNKSDKMQKNCGKCIKKI